MNTMRSDLSYYVITMNGVLSHIFISCKQKHV